MQHGSEIASYFAGLQSAHNEFSCCPRSVGFDFVSACSSYLFIFAEAT